MNKGAFMMQAVAQLRAGQSLIMTPQLQQSIRLLQLSAAEFEQEIEETLASNPFIERDDGPGADDEFEPHAESTQSALDSDSGEEGREGSEDAPSDQESVEWEDADSLRYNDTPAGERTDQPTDALSLAPAGRCLREHLLEQLSVCRINARDRQLSTLVIHALEPDGYLKTPVEELEAMCPEAFEVEPGELDTAIRLVQSFEPAGVGARTLQECLLIQLDQRALDTPGLALAQRIVKDHLPRIVTPDTTRLLREFECEELEFTHAYQLIRACSPRPGAPFSDERTDYVVADVQVRKIAKRWVARINPEVIPKIHVNAHFASLVSETRGAATSPIGVQLREARWFVRNVNQRYRTILRVAQAIVERQSRYFDYGDIALKPLVLRDIAQVVGVHESTVSRVTSNKYMMTPRGLVELRHFFCSHVASEGQACSASAVRALIRQILGAEDPRAPLSDVKVARFLAEKGVVVARRTVSKYRDSMHISSVEVRRLSAAPTLTA